jgi:quercetin dioxygenase-like cupin family protein
MNTADISPFLPDFSRLPRTTKLMRGEGIFVFLLHLKAEEEMPEHQVRGPITVHCLHGRALFVTGEDNLDLLPGTLVSLPGGAPHRLIARTASLLLVSVCEQVTGR